MHAFSAAAAALLDNGERVQRGGPAQIGSLWRLTTAFQLEQLAACISALELGS
jgi:hypothetical protein